MVTTVPMGRRPSLATRWAVVAAGLVVVALAIVWAVFGVAWAIDGAEAVEDTWVGWLTAAAILGGLGVSLAAFLVAISAVVRGEKARFLWVAVWVFPVLATTVALVEAFWIE